MKSCEIFFVGSGSAISEESGESKSSSLEVHKFVQQRRKGLSICQRTSICFRWERVSERDRYWETHKYSKMLSKCSPSDVIHTDTYIFSCLSKVPWHKCAPLLIAYEKYVWVFLKRTDKILINWIQRIAIEFKKNFLQKNVNLHFFNQNNLGQEKEIYMPSNFNWDLSTILYFWYHGYISNNSSI